MRQLVFALYKETKIPKSIIKDAPQSGPFDSYAEAIQSQYEILVTLADSIAYLKTLGAWDLEELQDLELNKTRLLWLAVMDCKERNESYWYMGG